MTPALAGVLQATAKLCLRHGIALKISHVAGERNPWADALSTVQGPLRCGSDWMVPASIVQQ